MSDVETEQEEEIDLQPLAEAVRDQYNDNPRLTINLVASALETTVQDVAKVLDEYEVQEDGSVVHGGPGQGGGWISEEIRVGLVQGDTISAEELGQHIGYRWPDGSLREIAFDINNLNHRAEFGLPDPEPEPSE